MLADGDRLLDQMVEVLGDVRGQTLRLQDAQDLVAGDEANLSDAVRVSQDHTWRRKREPPLTTVSNGASR